MSNTNSEKEKIIEELIYNSKQHALVRTRKYYYYTIIPFVIGLVWLVFSFSQVKNLGSQVSNLNDSITLIKKNLEKYRDSVQFEKKNLEILKYLKDSLQVEYLRYLQDNVSNNQVDYYQIEQSIKANNYLQNQLNSSRIDTSLNVWYFQKSLDAERVRLALKELGYKSILVNPTKETVLQSGETNTIAFGSDVPFYDLQVIALALIRTGFKIEYVYPSQRNRNQTNLIQIIRTVFYRNGIPVARKPLTVEHIINVKNKDEFITQ